MGSGEGGIIELGEWREGRELNVEERGCVRSGVCEVNRGVAPVAMVEGGCDAES